MPPRASSSTTNRPTNAKKKAARFSNTAPPSVTPGDVEILKSAVNDRVRVEALLLDLKAQQEAKVEKSKRREKEEAAIEAQAVTELEQRGVEPEEGGPQCPIKTPQLEESAINISSADKEDSDAMPPAPQIHRDKKGNAAASTKGRLGAGSVQRPQTECSLTVAEGPSAFDLAQTMRELMEKVERNIAKSASSHAEVAALRADLSAIRSEHASILKVVHKVSNVVGHILNNTLAHEEDNDDDAAEVEHAMLE